MKRGKVWTGLALGLLFACGGDPSDAEPELPSYTGTETVAAELDKKGGVMQLEAGVRVEVPADALVTKAMVELEVLESAGLPKVQQVQAQGLKKPVAFRPHGQTFERPVTVELPLKPLPNGASVHLLRLDDEEDTDWEELKTFRLRDPEDGEESDGGKILTFETARFSVYWAVAVPDDGEVDGGTMPPPDGGVSMGDGGSMVDAGGGGGADAGVDAAVDAGVKPDAGAEDAGDGSSDAGVDAAVDAGTAQDAGGEDASVSADAGMDGATAGDAAGTLYASCAEAFAAYPGVATNCTQDPSALGFDCEGIVGANTGLNCQQFCETIGNNCAFAYEATFGQCGSAQIPTTVTCEDYGDYYCGCGVRP